LRIRWAVPEERMWKKLIVYRLLIRRPDGRRPLGRPRCRWVDNINMDLVEIEWVVWTGLVS
jgi:hypothetical protein